MSELETAVLEPTELPLPPLPPFPLALPLPIVDAALPGFAEEAEECLLLEEEDEEEEEEEVDDVTDFEATAAAFANDAKPPKELLLFTGDWEVDTLEAGLVERADNDGNANKDFEANIEVLVLLLVGPKPDLIEDVCELPDTE